MTLPPPEARITITLFMFQEMTLQAIIHNVHKYLPDAIEPGLAATP